MHAFTYVTWTYISSKFTLPELHWTPDKICIFTNVPKRRMNEKAVQWVLLFENSTVYFGLSIVACRSKQSKVVIIMKTTYYFFLSFRNKTDIDTLTRAIFFNKYISTNLFEFALYPGKKFNYRLEETIKKVRLEYFYLIFLEIIANKIQDLPSLAFR